MLERGPVDVVVLAFGEPRFDGSILAELENAVSTGTIRVLDAMVLLKDDEGKPWQLQLEDLSAEQQEALGFVQSETRGLLGEEDADVFYEGMVPGSAIVALAIEHAWAVSLVNSIVDSGAEVALNFRVPAPIVSDAFATISTDS